MPAELPKGREALFVGDCILDNLCLNSFGMSQGHAKTNGAAIVLHKQGVAIQMEFLGKVLHDLR
jgi:hypothetical protein